MNKKLKIVLLATSAGLFIVSTIFFLLGFKKAENIPSIELALNSFSPNGSSGGVMIPASCASGYTGHEYCPPAPINGECNPSWHQTTKPSGTDFYAVTNLCNVPSTPDSDTNLSTTGSGWTWNCPEQNGGISASCWANKCVATGITWEDCDKSCGGGTMKGTSKDAECNDHTEYRACNSHPCPPGYREVTPW